ncbi:hypothetical protein [Flaviaesturariibacter terrae]
MKRFVADTALFLLFAAAAYLVLLFAVGATVPQRYQKNVFKTPDTRSYLRERIDELPRATGPDLLVLGPSVAQYGFDPRVFARSGYRLFVLASSGQNTMQTHILLKRYLDVIRPRRVVLAVYPEMNVEDRIEPSLDLILSDRVDADNWRDLLRRPNLRLSNTLLYWWMRQELGCPPPALRYTSTLDRYVSGGFQERINPVPNPDLAIACTPGPKPPLNPVHMRYLDSCLLMLRQRGIPYVLLQAPLSPKRYACHRDAPLVDSVFLRHGPYYNFNGRIALSDSFDFVDNVHLSPAGAVKFSRAVIDQFEKDAFLRH